MKKLYVFLSTLCLILTNTVSSQVATWMHGDKVANPFGVYGTQGIPDPANKPGGRQGAVSFTDAGNNFWLFGGYGGSAIDEGQLNDLWKYNSLTNQWTWVNGGNVSKSLGIYGSKGVSDPANKPGARQDAISWIDASGFLWLMGGYGYSSTGLGYLNDLWKYNPTSNQWTWVSGDNIHNQNGVYAGVAKPGSRHGAISWTDGTGNLWLMGGSGYASAGIGLLNDLWKYSPALNSWTWLSGSNVPNQPGVYGIQGVAAATNIPGSRNDAVSWFANNYLWLMGGEGFTESSSGTLNDLWKYDPLSNQWTWVSGDNTPFQFGVYGTKGTGASSNKPGSRRNAVGWKVMYGALWLMGGEGLGSAAPGWLNDLWKFDLTTNLWTWMHGDDAPYQYGNYGTRELPAPTNKEGSRFDAVGWSDAANNLWFLGGKGYDEVTGGLLNDLWRISNLPPTTSNLYYRDNDNDGYGDPSNSQVSAGAPPAGYVSNNTDCNDNNAAVHPGATEICNGIDDNCNGEIDEACGTGTTFYRDADSDGYGNPNITIQATTQPQGYVANSTDCDDNNTSVHPGATELCNGIDDNCNGQVDEGCGTTTTYYRDADGDGYGNPNVSIQASTPPQGYVANNTDCDDTKASVHPGATEVCNGIDDNCNGQIDEGVKLSFYRDADHDGYGNASNSVQACAMAPPGYVSNNTDCDDTKASVHPGANELCNGIDDDCDGQVDEGVKSTFYRDADGDGYGTAATTIQACAAPSGYVSNNTDCNDANAGVYPGAIEVCNNNIDDDCDGQIDEGCNTTSNQICAFDEDFYGSMNTTCVLGTQVNSKQMMSAAVDAQPNDSVSFGSKANSRYFTLRLSDVQNNDIFKMLPGSGDEKALKGYATFSKQNTWNNVPIKSNGRIDNELLTQTMTLFFNIHISPTLKNLSLDKKIMIRKLYFCNIPGSRATVSFHIKKSILNCLKSKYGENGATVNNLYVLANELLGNIKSCDKVKEKDVRKALENINEMFGRCVLFLGYGPKDNGDDDDDDHDNHDGDDDDDDDDNDHGDHDRIIGNHIFQNLQVSATPNPFHDRIQFTITSPVSGDVKIVLLDVNGKQVGEIKQKVFAKSATTVNYTVNRRRQGMLYYKVTVNNLSATGKLIQIN